MKRSKHLLICSLRKKETCVHADENILLFWNQIAQIPCSDPQINPYIVLNFVLSVAWNENKCVKSENKPLIPKKNPVNAFLWYFSWYLQNDDHTLHNLPFILDPLSFVKNVKIVFWSKQSWISYFEIKGFAVCFFYKCI